MTRSVLWTTTAKEVCFAMSLHGSFSGVTDRSFAAQVARELHARVVRETQSSTNAHKILASVGVYVHVLACFG